MTERPILFQGPMVRALLAGTKTQTRRVVKPQFATDALPVEMPATDAAGGWVIPGHSGVWWCEAACNPDDVRRCPNGQPGDRLWACEAWRAPAEFDRVKHSDLRAPNGGLLGTPIVHEATRHGSVQFGKLRPGMFMAAGPAASPWR